MEVQENEEVSGSESAIPRIQISPASVHEDDHLPSLKQSTTSNANSTLSTANSNTSLNTLPNNSNIEHSTPLQPRSILMSSRTSSRSSIDGRSNTLKDVKIVDHVHHNRTHNTHHQHHQHHHHPKKEENENSSHHLGVHGHHHHHHNDHHDHQHHPNDHHSETHSLNSFGIEAICDIVEVKDEQLIAGGHLIPSSLPLAIRKFLKKVTYYRVHFAMFSLIGLLGAIIIYGIEENLAFMDALFIAISALSVTGLSSVDFSQFRIGSQITTWFLILCGGAVLESFFPVLLRWYYMRRSIKKNAALKAFTYPVLEYRSLTRLLIFIPMYWFCAQMTSFLIMGLQIHFSSYADVCAANGVNGWWFAAFISASSFNNAGFAPFYDNLVQMALNPAVLIPSGCLIMLGNIGYPAALRYLIVTYHKLSKKFRFDRNYHSTYHFLLKYPRRVATHLFPSYHTKWLFAVVTCTTVGQWILVAALDWTHPALSSFTPFYKLLNAWYSAVVVRTAGFNSIDITLLNEGTKVVFIVMMYMASYPITVSLRSTNSVVEPFAEKSRSAKNPVFQLQRLLIEDLTWLFLPFIVICIIESENLKTDPNFTHFKILFEIASAYGTVGLTLGYPGIPYSFSGVLSPGSKFVIIVVMFMGRHRGLPDFVDSAVQLFPVKELITADEERIIEQISRGASRQPSRTPSRSASKQVSREPSPKHSKNPSPALSRSPSDDNLVELSEIDQKKQMSINISGAESEFVPHQQQPQPQQQPTSPSLSQSQPQSQPQLQSPQSPSKLQQTQQSVKQT